MKSKLAIWSWILPIIGYIVFILISINLGDHNILRAILSVIFIIGSTITGLIFGAVALNSKMDGKAHAIVGIILNVILFIFGCFGTLIAFLGNFPG